MTKHKSFPSLGLARWRFGGDQFIERMKVLKPDGWLKGCDGPRFVANTSRSSISMLTFPFFISPPIFCNSSNWFFSQPWAFHFIVKSSIYLILIVLHYINIFLMNFSFFFCFFRFLLVLSIAAFFVWLSVWLCCECVCVPMACEGANDESFLFKHLGYGQNWTELKLPTADAERSRTNETTERKMMKRKMEKLMNHFTKIYFYTTSFSAKVHYNLKHVIK